MTFPQACCHSSDSPELIFISTPKKPLGSQPLINTPTPQVLIKGGLFTSGHIKNDF